MMKMAEKSSILKFITKKVFVKAKEQGNYGEVTKEAQAVIDSADNLDILELRTRMGSALEVLSAKKVNEQRFGELLRG